MGSLATYLPSVITISSVHLHTINYVEKIACVPLDAYKACCTLSSIARHTFFQEQLVKLHFRGGGGAVQGNNTTEKVER